MQLVRIVILVLAIAAGNLAQAQCPENYTTPDNRSCYMFSTTAANRKDAADRCADDGGYLASIPSKFIDDYLGSIVDSLYDNGINAIWVGITQDLNSGIFKNDDGTPFGPYTNFQPGKKYTSSYIIKPYSETNYWQEQNDTFNDNWNGYVCELPVSICLPGYSFWRGNCYSVNISTANEDDSEKSCIAENGHLASIHSDAENDFILSLLKAKKVSYSLFRIGLQYTDSSPFGYNWTDGSTANYTSNIENLNTGIGDCFAMSLSGRTAKPGNWSSANCESHMPYVCKAGKVYDDKMILAPLTCNSTTDITGSGVLYSPGYPLPYTRSDCQYDIYQKKGEQVVISFDILNLANNSTLSIYNDESLSELVMVLNSTTTKVDPITSIYDSLTILFEYDSDVAQPGTGWKITYTNVTSVTANKKN